MVVGMRLEIEMDEIEMDENEAWGLRNRDIS